MDRQLLSRATENSDAPTPGYMYLDIAKNAASNPQICQEIAKYLTGRLASKRTPNIKHKCLKIIAKVCQSPYSGKLFKRTLAQDPQAMQAIKDSIQFRGPPDPVRGDQPYSKVREAAQEALDAVYSDDAPPSAPSDSMGGMMGGGGGGGYSGGYGGPVAGGGGGGGGGGPRRMEGIGNPMFQDPRLAPQPKGIANMTVNDLVSEAKETVIGIIKDPLAKNVDIRSSNAAGAMPRAGGYNGPTAGGGSGSYNRPPPGRSDIMHQTNGEWTMASNRGPGAVGGGGMPQNYNNDSSYYKSRDNTDYKSQWQQGGAGGMGGGGVGGSWANAGGGAGPYGHQATPSITVNHNPAASSMGGVVSGSGGGTAVSDGSYERQLVMELCPPGGMKPEPPPDKLASFSRLVASLNPDLVCPVLLDCLEEGQPWIIRAKALWVMDACVRNGQRPDGSHNPYADFFHACSAEIAPLANHTRAAIRDPAKRVLNALGVAVPVGGVAAPPLRSGGTAAPPFAPPPAPVANLLDFDAPAEPAMAPSPATAPPEPTTVAAAPAPTPAGDGGGSLFGGLNVAGGSAPPAPPPAAAAPPPPAESLLDLMGDAAPADTTPKSSSAFGFLNDGAASSAPASAAPAPAPAPPAMKEAAGMFDNMSLKSNESSAAATTSTTETAAAAGSAFGFMNSTGSTDATEKKVDGLAAVAGAGSAKDSFDPLKHKLTPNSQQKMMQISPEQMQAMMYQQMMMQQQMQMAQMQMAMQNAQKRGSASSQMGKVGGGLMTMPGHVMQNPAASKSTFAFMDKPQKKDDHSFDFVQDALKKEKK